MATVTPDSSGSELARIMASLDLTRLPAHVAIITDGNGRWAQKRHLPRLLGHREGYKTLVKIVRAASDIGIKVVTVYAFSSENWSRPQLEVDGLMHLIEHAVTSELSEMQAKQVRLRFVGRREGLSESLKRTMDAATAQTEHNLGLTLNLAVNYGGRSEITDAARALAQAVARGEIDPNTISEAHLAARMYAADLPDPDLLIRTAGEMRVSNFLLWGIAYAEMWITPAFWPDFSLTNLGDALQDYQKRVRKFGAVVKE